MAIAISLSLAVCEKSPFTSSEAAPVALLLLSTSIVVVGFVCSLAALPALLCRRHHRSPQSV